MANDKTDNTTGRVERSAEAASEFDGFHTEEVVIPIRVEKLLEAAGIVEEVLKGSI